MERGWDNPFKVVVPMTRKPHNRPYFIVLPSPQSTTCWGPNLHHMALRERWSRTVFTSNAYSGPTVPPALLWTLLRHLTCSFMEIAWSNRSQNQKEMNKAVSACAVLGEMRPAACNREWRGLRRTQDCVERTSPGWQGSRPPGGWRRGVILGQEVSLTKSQRQKEGKLVCLVWGEVGKWRPGLNPHANFEGLSLWEQRVY